MSAKYLLCPGDVRGDGGSWQHVTAQELARLYGLRIEDCTVLPTAEPGALGGGMRRFSFLVAADKGEYVALHPRSDGNYKLPVA